MKDFMQTHKVYLTPLSPIHIGCGEDFEPTNYVIDNQVLYHFDPIQADFNEPQKQELMKCAERSDLLAIQRFFAKYKQQGIDVAHYFANVSSSFEQHWKSKIGQVVQRENDLKKVIAQLAIERCSYLPFENEPYIPGSSFKGALATCLLDAEHQIRCSPKVRKEESQDLLKKYIGTFADSKLRRVKFADFVPVNTAYTQVNFSLNFKKEVKTNEGKGRGIPLRRECITQGQYRAFQSELALWEDKNKPEYNKQTAQDFIQLLNQYYLPVFKKETQLLLERNLISKQWATQILNLLENGDANKLSRKNMALIRLGKSGADSKVYQNDVAQIKIMKGKGIRPEDKSSSTTVWLSGQQENQSFDLLPFGWALVEFDPIGNNEALKQWCEQQAKTLSFDKAQAIKAREAKLQAIKQKKQQAYQQELERLEQERQKAEQLELQKQAEQAMLASLSDNQRQVMDFIEQIKSTTERQMDTTGSAILKTLNSLVDNAVQSWSSVEKQFFVEQINIDLIKTKVDFKKKDTEKNIKKQLNKLLN